MNELEGIALKRVICPKCGARPQEDCMDLIQGVRAYPMHIERVGPLYTAYDIGEQVHVRAVDIDAHQ